MLPRNPDNTLMHWRFTQGECRWKWRIQILPVVSETSVVGPDWGQECRVRIFWAQNGKLLSGFLWKQQFQALQTSSSVETPQPQCLWKHHHQCYLYSTLKWTNAAQNWEYYTLATSGQAWEWQHFTCFLLTFSVSTVNRLSRSQVLSAPRLFPKPSAGCEVSGDKGCTSVFLLKDSILDTLQVSFNILTLETVICMISVKLDLII